MSIRQIYEPYQEGVVCLLCGDAMEVAERAYQQHGVCGICAEFLANHWSMAHSGRWLTWENTQLSKPTKAVIPSELRMAVFRRDGFKCVACDSIENLTADHVYPESKGGPTTFDNLQTLCRSCNSRKGNRT